MAVKIQLRRDTAANWTSTNPVLAQGEPGLETDTGKIKYGNGITDWSGLTYQSGGTVAYADLTGKPTLGTASLLDVAATGNAGTTEVVKGNDTRLSDARTPTAHNQAASTITGLATVATTGAYSDLSGKPTLGTAAAENTTAFATAAQGNLADSAVQPADLVAAGKVIYVDTTTGSDTAAGDLESAPLKTITAALTQAQSGDCISIGAGIYTEAAPMIVPRNVSLIGDDLRATEIRPTTDTATNNLFLVDSGTRFFSLTFARHQAGAWAIAFNPNANNTSIGASGLGAYITKSPYIQNCTSYTAQDDSGLAGSISDGTTGGGMEVDGSKCAPNSPIRSMVVDSYTQVNLDGPGCLVKNDGYAQLVSFFGTFCSYHVKAETGGQVNLSNSTTDFGTYGLVADGRSTTALFTGTGASASSGANQIDVTSLSANRLGGSNRPAIGQVFDLGGTSRTITLSVAITGGYAVTFYPALSSAYAGGSISFYQRSQISTGGHTMEYVGSGTNYLALPWNGGVPVQDNEVVETNGGRVFFSTTDHLGDFRVGDQFLVHGTTGEVTINTSSFNISGLNQVGPFSRDGGLTNVGVQLREVSNNTTLLASTGSADGNTAPTQLAVKSYTDGKFLTSVTGSGPISSSGGLTPIISISAATNESAGSMSSADKIIVDNLGTASPLDVAVSGNAGTTEVVKGDDTRLTDARTPTAHNQAASTITGLGTAATLNTGTASNTVATGDDSRFGSTATTLTVASNATTLDASQGTRRVYLLTITSTSAFTFTLSNLPTGADWWEAEVIITTTAVPASFTFAGSSTKVDVTNSTLTNNPFATGKITSMLLSKQTDGRYTAQFSPAQLAS